MKNVTLSLFTIATVMLSFLVSPTSAQVTPQYATATYSSSGNSIPWAYSSGGCRGQYLYPPSVFPANISAGQQITKLYWMPWTGSSGTASFSQLHISLKQANISSMGPSYETGMTNVYSSTSATFTYSGGQWFEIELQNPFPYDPTLPLIVEVNQLHSPFSNFYCALIQSGSAPTGTGRVFSNSYNATSPLASSNPYAIALGFDLEPVSTSPNDIGVTSIDSPYVFCDGPHNVVATVKNFGINQVDTFRVNWSINGTLQTPVDVYTLLDTFKGVNPNEAQVVLGSHTFQSNVMDTIEAWTSNPNNVTDTVTSNDSSMAERMPSIYGNFTIDPTGSGANNYTTFSALAQDLSDFGVCGPVIVTVKPGTYTEQVTFDQIAGTSAQNYIEFSPDTGGAVILQYSNATFQENYVVSLNGASWITFNDFNFVTNASSYATVINFGGSAAHNTFMNCVFDGYANASFSFYQAIIYSSASGNDYNKFHHCTFNNGSYGLYYRGGGTTSTNEGCEWIDCDFNDQYYRGAYFYYTTDLKFKNNRMQTSKNYSSMYGVQSYYSYDEVEITGNDINIPGYTGLYLYYNQGTTSKRPLIANNFVRIGKGAGSWGYGIYCYQGGYARIVNNTIATTHSSGTYAAIYVNGGVNSVLNNLIHDMNGNTASFYGSLYFNGAFAVAESDYNNIYTNRYWGRLSTGEYLADWQNSTGFDMHSLTSDPGFVNFDSLRTCSDTIEGAGTSLSYLTDDFDGDGRHPSTPDIGADEWVGSDTGSYSAGPDAIICDGKPAIIGLKSSGGTFNWNTGDTTSTIEVSEAGEYVVSMTSGCGFSHVDTVQVDDVTPVADFDVSSVFLTGDFTNQSDNDWTRMWVVGTVPPDTLYSDDLTYVFPDNGPYDVTLYIYNDCDTDMVTKTWTGYVGIAENDLNNAITVMPNPVSDVLNIEFTGLEGDVTVEMMNIQGQIVHSDRYMNVKGYARESIDVSSLNKGMYIVKFMTDQGIATKQIVVQ